MTPAAEGAWELLEAAGPTAAGPGRAVLRMTRDVRADELVRMLVPSRPMVARIFGEGQLTGGDGAVLRRTDELASGAVVSLSLVAAREPGPSSDAPVRVLWRDPFLMAVDKPAGLLVHGDGTGADTLTARVQGLLAREGCAAVPQAVQRLDVDTTGVVLLSLTEELQPAFDALVSGDGLTKRYLALVDGPLPGRPGADGWLVVEAPIARDRHDARRMRVGRTGKPAATRLRMVGERAGRTLVEAELVTGRRHQIRVHLAHLGRPIVGDALYGGARDASGLRLHAHEARLTHPVTGKGLSIACPCPW